MNNKSIGLTQKTQLPLYLLPTAYRLLPQLTTRPASQTFKSLALFNVLGNLSLHSNEPSGPPSPN